MKGVETMQELTTIISTVGFPIVSFLISAYFIKYTYDRQLEQDNKYRDQEKEHWECIASLTTAVNNNTAVLREMVQKQSREEENHEN